MTLTPLAIQTEAWLQEEIGAQRQMLAVLVRIEAAARAGEHVGLERGGREFEGLLAPSAAREARRRALLGRLATALGLPASGVTLSRLLARLEAEQHGNQRLQAMRAELREVVAAVLKTGRRLAALAQYHHGLMGELSALLRAGADSQGHDGVMVDAHG